MPALYVCLHLLLTTYCIAAALLLRSQAARGTFGGLLFTVTALGFGVERFADWAWSAFSARLPDLVYLSNLSLEALGALLAVLWRSASTPPMRARAVVVTLLGLGVAGQSYAWYFQPTPAGLRGKVNRWGFCPQTSGDSCSAASAAMLLHAGGIEATEAEMARLCLTRTGIGTPTLGMFRGVTMKARERGLAPHVLVIPVGAWGRAASQRLPAIISVGIRGKISPELRSELEGYGWAPGLRHALLLKRADPKGQWIDVADPSVGLERWPTRNLEHLWDGRLMVLQPKDGGKSAPIPR